MTAALRQVTEIDPDALEALWTAVNKAGGAVGFRPDSPQEDVHAAAVDVVAKVRSGALLLITAESAGEIVGTVFLQPGLGDVFGHRGTVLRLMVHPDVAGRGLGTELLAAVVALARATGLEQLLLAVRGGTPTVGFYARRGWTEVGRFPDALRLGQGEYRDEHWFQLRLERS